jgi:hypothetical protein
MNKLKLDDYTVTTIEIYLNNDNPHHTNEMIDFLAKKYDLGLGTPLTDPCETIVKCSGSTRFPEPPESELARENERLREDYQWLASSRASLQGIANKRLLGCVLVSILLAFILCAAQIWRVMR